MKAAFGSLKRKPHNKYTTRCGFFCIVSCAKGLSVYSAIAFSTSGLVGSTVGANTWLSCPCSFIKYF